MISSNEWKKLLDCLVRAVKKFLSSRLTMNSRQLWNLHQKHKFLRAKAPRDILKIRVSEMAFSGVFKRYFPPRMPCCFVRIHTRPVLEQCHLNVPAVPRHRQFEHFTDLNLFEFVSFKTGKRMLYNLIQWCLFC